MKKIITLTLIVGFLILGNVQAQDYYQGTVKVELTSSGPQLVFYIKLTGSNRTEGFTSLEFFITYPNTRTMTFGTVVNNTTSFPTLAMVYGGQNSQGGGTTGTTNEWWYYSNPTGTTSTTYTAGVEYEVFRVPVSTSSVDFGDLQLEYDGTNWYTYLAISNNIGQGLTTADQGLNIPVYYGPGTYSGANGDGLLAGGYCSYTIFDKPLVPMVLWDDAVWAGGSGTGNQPGAGDGSKKCYVRDANGALSVAGGVVNNLIIQAGADLNIQPGATLTANGPTTITDAQALTIEASASGIGSFIDNGTISYGGSGSAAVETYLSNGGTYYYHQVGPTVDNLGTGSGVPLGNFNISSGNTFAFEWNEATQAWVNQYTTTYPVYTGTGLMLTTDDGSSGEYAQVGTLINTNVTVNLLLSGDPSTAAYGWNLKSNPYSAALDWDDTWTREDPVSTNDLNPTVYILNNGNSTFAQYNASTDVGTGMSKDIQVGQGFWVQYVQSPYSAPGNIDITLQPSDRNHSTQAFLKEGIVDQLTLTAAGNNSADVLAIVFRDYGTPKYDLFADVDKWESYWDHATEIWTVSDDQKSLTHNILPTLGNSHVAVPMSFECHENMQYTITASDIESFQGNVEIYLEDLQAGGEWHDFLTNNVYTFDGNPEDPQARFVVHFFGVTGIGDPTAIKPVQIYSWKQDAYIVNHSSQTIKEYHVYDMMGRELQSGTLPNSTVNKVTIGNVSAYYIVKVITKEGGVYTDKVYITE